MRLLLSLLLLYSFFGCSLGLRNKIEPPYEDFVSSFEQTFHTKYFGSVRSYDNLREYGVLGLCRNYGFNNRKNIVFIDSRWWDGAGYDAREQMIFHELGHCVLNRKHEDSFIIRNATTIPKSIMYPVVFGELSIYKDNRDYYINELKGK